MYYNYTLSNNGVAEEHNDTYEVDYLTDLVKNRSVAFMEEQVCVCVCARADFFRRWPACARKSSEGGHAEVRKTGDGLTARNTE